MEILLIAFLIRETDSLIKLAEKAPVLFLSLHLEDVTWERKNTPEELEQLKLTAFQLYEDARALRFNSYKAISFVASSWRWNRE